MGKATKKSKSFETAHRCAQSKNCLISLPINDPYATNLALTRYDESVRNFLKSHLLHPFIILDSNVTRKRKSAAHSLSYMTFKLGGWLPLLLPTNRGVGK